MFDQALLRMREACMHDGMETHWVIFEARSVRPLLHGSAPAEIDAELDELILVLGTQKAIIKVKEESLGIFILDLDQVSLTMTRTGNGLHQRWAELEILA